MKHNEMVERVARAIAMASGDNPDALTGSLLNENERYWQHYIEQALAAINAMREPTDTMIKKICGTPKQTKSMTLRYRDMIDAAADVAFY